MTDKAQVGQGDDTTEHHPSTNASGTDAPDSTSTTAQTRELLTLNFRLASAKDTKMTLLLEATLTSVLECLDPSKPSVQKAAVEVVSHVMKRVKASSAIKLPCRKLLIAMSAPQATPFTINFSVMLLDLGVPKLDGNELCRLFPALVRSLPRHAPTIQGKFLRLVLKCLPHVNTFLSKDEISVQEIKDFMEPIFDHVTIHVNNKSSLGGSPLISGNNGNSVKALNSCTASENLVNLTKELQVLLDFFLDVLLYVLPSPTQHILTPPAGLAVGEVRRIIGNAKSRVDLPSVTDLRRWQSDIVEFMCRTSRLINDAHLIQQFVVGSVLAPNNAAQQCRTQLKGFKQHRIGLEDKHIVGDLMKFCVHGVSSVERALKHSVSTRKDKNKSGASHPGNTSAPPVGVRVRMVDLLTLSKIACRVVPGCVEVASKTVFATTSSTRLQSSGLKFLAHLFANTTQKLLVAVSPSMFKGLHKLVKQAVTQLAASQGHRHVSRGVSVVGDMKSKKEMDDMLESLFMAVAQLARCQPKLFSILQGDGIALVKTLFQTMATEAVDQRICLAARGALAAVRASFVSMSSNPTVDKELSVPARNALLNIIIDFVRPEVTLSDTLLEVLVDWLNPSSGIFLFQRPAEAASTDVDEIDERDTIHLTAVFTLIWLCGHAGPVRRSAQVALSLEEQQGGDKLIFKRQQKKGKKANMTNSAVCDFEIWLRFLHHTNKRISRAIGSKIACQSKTTSLTPVMLLIDSVPSVLLSMIKFSSKCLAYSNDKIGKSGVISYLSNIAKLEPTCDRHGGLEKRIRLDKSRATHVIILQYHDMLAAMLGMRTVQCECIRAKEYSRDSSEYLPVLRQAALAMVNLYQSCPSLVSETISLPYSQSGKDNNHIDHIKFMAQHHDNLIRSSFASILSLFLRYMPLELQRETINDLVNGAQRIPDRKHRFLQAAIARGISMDVCAHGALLTLGHVVSLRREKVKSTRLKGENTSLLSDTMLTEISNVVVDRVIQWRVASDAAAISHQRKRALVVASLGTLTALIATGTLHLGSKLAMCLPQTLFQHVACGVWKANPVLVDQTVDVRSSERSINKKTTNDVDNKVLEETRARIAAIKAIDDYDEKVNLMSELNELRATLKSRSIKKFGAENADNSSRTLHCIEDAKSLPTYTFMHISKNVQPGTGPHFTPLLADFGGCAALSNWEDAIFHTTVELTSTFNMKDLDEDCGNGIILPALFVAHSRCGASVPCIYLSEQSLSTNLMDKSATIPNAANKSYFLEGQIRGSQLVWQTVELCNSAFDSGSHEFSLGTSSETRFRPNLMALAPPSAWNKIKNYPLVSQDSISSDDSGTKGEAADHTKTQIILQPVDLILKLTKMLKSNDLTIACATITLCTNIIVTSLLESSESSMSVFSPYLTVLIDQLLDRCRSKYEEVQRAVGHSLATLLISMAVRSHSLTTSSWQPCYRDILRKPGATSSMSVHLNLSVPSSIIPRTRPSSSKLSISPAKVCKKDASSKKKNNESTQSAVITDAGDPTTVVLRTTTICSSKLLSDYTAPKILEHIFGMPTEAKMGRAVGIWLLELLIIMRESHNAAHLWPWLSKSRFCNGLPAQNATEVAGVDIMLKIQDKFLGMLRHRDVMCTEEAARGLVLLYRQATLDDSSSDEKSDTQKQKYFTNVKKKLLTQLMQSLNLGDQLKQSGKKNKGKWSGKTTVPPVYRELYALARELGDTALIYEFLPAAVASTEGVDGESNNDVDTNNFEHHSASSLRSAIFGSATPTLNEHSGHAVESSAVTISSLGIAAAVSEEIDRGKLLPYMSRLIPRLFVMRNTPDRRVQRAVKALWTVLVDDDAPVISRHRDSILRHCLKAMNDSSWLRRCAGCNAVTEALSGIPVEDVIFMEVRTEEGIISESTDFLEVLHSSYKKTKSDQIPPLNKTDASRTMYLLLLWQTVLRSVDDARKESRIMGTVAAFAVKKFIERATNRLATANSLCQFTVDHLIPYLIDKGIYNSAKEGRLLSIDLLRNIAKECGECICPHAVNLACGLLESLSSLESSRLVYLQQQTHTDRLSHVENANSKVENLRLQAAKQSPMQETLDVVVKFIVPSQFGQVMPKLATILKRGVGLATRVATASFVQTLMDRFESKDCKPYAQTILKAMESGIIDMQSAGVRKAYARAAASTIRRAKTGTVKKFLAFIANWAWNGTDEGRSTQEGPISSGTSSNVSAKHAGEVMHQIARYAPKSVKRFETEVVPVAFVLRQQSSAAIAPAKRHVSGEKNGQSKINKVINISNGGESAWDAVWDLCVPSIQAGIRMFSNEIIVLGIVPSLRSPRWVVKQKAGMAIQEICQHLAASELEIHCNDLVTGLDEALTSSRGMWTGKEDIILAFAAVLCNCSKTAAKIYPIDKFAAVLANEARKASRGGALEYAVKEGFSGAKQGNKVVILEGGGSSDPQCARYVRHIFAAFHSLGAAFPDFDFWPIVRPAVLKVVCPPHFEKDDHCEADEIDHEVKFLIPPVLQLKGFECLAGSWHFNDQATISGSYVQEDAGICASAALRGPWSVTVAALKAISTILRQLPPAQLLGLSKNNPTSYGVEKALHAVQTALKSLKFSKVRVAAIKTAVVFITVVKEASKPRGGHDGSIKPSQHCANINIDLIQSLNSLRTDDVPAVAAAAHRASTKSEDN